MRQIHRVALAVVITITITSISAATASPLALDAWCNRLASALYLSEDKYSACGLDHRNWRVPWYVTITVIDVDPSPSSRMLGRHDFKCIR